MSSEPVVKQLQNAHQRIKELEARLHAHAPTDRIMVDVVKQWLEANRLAEPAANSTPTDSDGARGKPGSRPPSGRDPRLVRARDRFEKALSDAIHLHENMIARIDEPKDPRKTSEEEAPSAKWPKVTCYRRGCELRRKRMPSVHVADGAIEPIWDCPSCGCPYTKHPAGQHTDDQSNMAQDRGVSDVQRRDRS